MTIRRDIEAVISDELGSAQRALQNGDPERATREVRDAISKLQEIARKVNHLEIAARKS